MMKSEGNSRRHRFAQAIAPLLVCTLLCGCGSEGSEEARKAFEDSGSTASLPQGHPPVQSAPDAYGSATAPTSSSVAGIAWTASEHWEAQGARAMRAATYTIRTNREGTAECAVYFFGTGQGGGVQANIDRWVNQFEQPDGTPSAGRATSSHSEQSGWPLTRVEVSGTYTAGMGPAGQTQGQEPQAGYKLLGAIIEGPQGAVFFKLTGPDAVVEDSRDEFDALLLSIRPAA